MEPGRPTRAGDGQGDASGTAHAAEAGGDHVVDCGACVPEPAVTADAAPELALLVASPTALASPVAPELPEGPGSRRARPSPGRRL